MRKAGLFIVVLFTVSRAWATCGSSGTILTAASASAPDVQDCFTAAVASTTKINIPSGTPTWTTQVTFTVPSGSTNISIIGAGSSSTVITENYASSNSVLSIVTNSTSTSLVRLSGIKIIGSNATVKFGGLIGFSGSEQVRFDNSIVDTSGVSQEAGVRLDGCIYGVADHDTFTAGSSQVNNAIQEYNQSTCYSDSLGVGDQAWAHATNFGTSKAFYLENDTFNNGFANDCTKGGSFVARFNTFNETANNNSVVQTHPTGGAGRWRGCRQSETYMNTFTLTTGTSFMNACLFISSGTGLAWGNSAASIHVGTGQDYGCKQFVQFESVLISNTAYGQTATPNGWGYCGTQSGLTGDGSNWNGNTVTSTGYACLDQPGRGQGDLLTGGFTSDGSGSNNVTNNATSCTSSSACAYPRQGLEPYYLWGSGWLANSWQPVPNNTSHFAAVNSYSLTPLLTANVDFYTGIDDSGNPISFTGATGVGAGTRASRPSTCTTGVAYWSTDQGSWNQSGSGGQGVLDKCTSTNTWTNAFYTPYTYPHPLTQTGVSPLLMIANNITTTITGTEGAQ